MVPSKQNGNLKQDGIRISDAHSSQIAPNSAQPPQTMINNNMNNNVNVNNMMNIAPPPPPQQVNIMNNMMNGVQRMNINVNIPPQPQMNGVQGSPGRYTPEHQ